MTTNKKKIQANHQSKDTSKKQLFVIAAIAIVIIVILFVFPGVLRKKGHLEAGKNAEGYYMFKKEGELLFTDSLGSIKIKIEIEIADTDFDRQLGLMKRISMEENQGMLFVFPAEGMQSFWMRNTLFSLDMIFVNSKKEIVTIHKNTKILSDESYPSTAPAQYVVEVNSGFTSKNKIEVGDKVEWVKIASK